MSKNEWKNRVSTAGRVRRMRSSFHRALANCAWLCNGILLYLLKEIKMKNIVVRLALLAAGAVVGVAPMAHAQTTYTSHNIGDFTVKISSYATFSNFSNSDGCASSPFTPTSSELAGPNACRVYTGTLTGTGLPPYFNNDPNNWILATFSSAVSSIVVFPNIDHVGSAYDGYQYQIYGSNDGANWTILFDAVTVNGTGEPFTLGTFTGTAPTTVNNVVTGGCRSSGCVGYEAQFTFDAAYKYYAFGASTEAFNSQNTDQELSAVGTPVAAVQTQPASGTSPVTYVFNGTAGQTVEQIVDLSKSGVDVTGVSVTVTDGPIKSTDFPNLVAFTSFAVDQCFIMQGEKDGSGNPACKQYQILCTTSTNTTPSGTNCPVSTARNEFYEAVFSPAAASTLMPTGPGNSLPLFMGNPTAVAYPMAIDSWGGGNCVFPDSTLADELCPQNFLTTFSSVGDPTYATTITVKNVNSTVIPTYNHPEQQTAVTVEGQNSAGWNNSNTVVVNFSTQAPFFSPAPNNFVPAPIARVDYWVDQTANDTNSPPASAMLAKPSGMCPAPSTTPPTPPSMPLPAFVSSATLTGLADGSHVLGYFSTDCAGTEELLFTKPSGGNWMTSFLTKPINVDTTRPTISVPTLSPLPTMNNGIANSYLLNQSVTATYTCTDPVVGGVPSGVATCGPGNTNGTPTPTPGIFTSPVSTSAKGPSNFTVNATDVAGNAGFPAPAPYTVVDQPVNLDLFYVAASKIKPGSTGSNLAYFIAAVNLAQTNVASGVVVTDTVPAGTTVVPGGAFFDKVTCSSSGCSVPKTGTPCSVSGQVVTCKIGSLAPLNTLTGAGILIVVKVPPVTPTMPLGTVLTDTATAKSWNADTDGIDNSVIIKTTVTN